MMKLQLLTLILHVIDMKLVQTARCVSKATNYSIARLITVDSKLIVSLSIQEVSVALEFIEFATLLLNYKNRHSFLRQMENLLLFYEIFFIFFKVITPPLTIVHLLR